MDKDYKKATDVIVEHAVASNMHPLGVLSVMAQIIPEEQRGAVIKGICHELWLRRHTLPWAIPRPDTDPA